MLSTLRKQATITAKFHGHKLKWIKPWHGESKSVQDAFCLYCDAEVQINTKPAPNSIDIGGPAIALSCSNNPTNW